MFFIFILFQGTVFERTPQSDELYDAEKAKSHKFFNLESQTEISLSEQILTKSEENSSNPSNQHIHTDSSIQSTYLEKETTTISKEQSTLSDDFQHSLEEEKTNFLFTSETEENTNIQQQNEHHLHNNQNIKEENHNEHENNEEEIHHEEEHNNEEENNEHQNNNEEEIHHEEEHNNENENNEHQNNNEEENDDINENDIEEPPGINENDIGEPPGIELDQKEDTEETKVKSEEISEKEKETDKTEKQNIDNDDEDQQIDVQPGFEFNGADEKEKQDEKQETSMEKSKPIVKMAKYHIISVDKDEVSGKGGDTITVHISTNVSELVFARYDNENENIVTGVKESQTTCSFPVPRMLPGVYNLSVSFDRKKWTEPIKITVIDEESKAPKLILGIFLICVMIFMAITAKHLWAKGKRRRRLEKLKNKRMSTVSPLVLNQVPQDSKNIHHRNRITVDL